MVQGSCPVSSVCLLWHLWIPYTYAKIKRNLFCPYDEDLPQMFLNCSSGLISTVENCYYFPKQTMASFMLFCFISLFSTSYSASSCLFCSSAPCLSTTLDGKQPRSLHSYWNPPSHCFYLRWSYWRSIVCDPTLLENSLLFCIQISSGC